MPEDKLDKDEEIQNTTASGRSPKKRIVNAKAALAMVVKMKQSGEEAAYTRASIQGLYDGNPPFSRAEMKRRGYGWMANVDWGEFRNTINLTATSIWNMFVNTPTLISAQTDIEDPQNPQNDYGKKIAVRFTQAVKRHKPFRYDTMRQIIDMLKFGVSASYWQDDTDWRSLPVRTSNLLMPAKAEVRPGGLKLFGLRDELFVEDLYEMIEGDDVDSGWNLDYVRKKILKVVEDGNTSDGGDRYNISEWESMQQMVKNEDAALDKEFDGIKVVHLFSEEIGEENGYEGRKITHQIVLEHDDGGGNDKDKEVEFMYEKPRRFLNMESVINLSLYNVSDGWIKSVKGLGREIFHPSHASNRMLNSMLDGVVMGSGLLVQLMNANAAEKFNVVRKGPVTIVPEDAKLQQQQMQPTITPTVQARGIIQNISNKNVGTSRGRNENLQGSSPTAAQVFSEDTNEADLQNNQAEWFYLAWEAWLQESFKRIMNPSYSDGDGGYDDHKWMMDKLKADGVPKEVLKPELWEVTATRSIGMGSNRSRMEITTSMLGMMAGLDEHGKQNVKKEWFAARVGWENVPDFVDEIDRNKIFLHAHSMAEGENIDMDNGSSRTVPVDDPHSIHWAVHSSGVTQIIKRFMEKQSVQIEKDVIAVGRYLEHMVSHLQNLAQDPIREDEVKMYESELKQYADVFKQMGSMADALKKEQQELAAAQQKTVEDARKALASRDLEAAKYESEKKAEVAKYEAQLLHEARMMKANTSVMAQITKLQNDIQVMNARIGAEINREDVKAASEINRNEG